MKGSQVHRRAFHLKRTRDIAPDKMLRKPKKIFFSGPTTKNTKKKFAVSFIFRMKPYYLIEHRNSLWNINVEYHFQCLLRLQRGGGGTYIRWLLRNRCARKEQSLIIDLFEAFY